VKYPFLPRVARKIRRESRVAIAPLTVMRLQRRNLSSTAAVVDSSHPVYVSLTTHGNRLDTVHLTIESIARGRERPGRIVLWLDDESAWENRPAALRRLEKRGLEIRLTDNLGPHTKYYPALGDLAPDALLVTADDDMFYPVSWLQGLVRAHRRDPELIHCHRAHLVTFDAPGSLRPYEKWDECWTSESSIAVFATGVSGVIYPRAMIDLLQAGGTGFLGSAPKADDVYLHSVAASNGIRVKQIKTAPEHYAMLPDSQDQGLYHDNVKASGNDAQITASYSTDLLHEIEKARSYIGSRTRP
jgi:hypothetical protein